MACRFCGATMPVGARFCGQCGAPLPAPGGATEGDDGAPDYSPGPPPWAQQFPPAPPGAPAPLPFDLPRAADWSPFLQALAPVRDYTRRAWIAFILYGVLFFPGLIASAYWWREARQEEVRSGIAPRGKGCLTALVLYGIAMVALGLMGFLVYVAM